jgi:hypothetical protein
MRKYPSPSSRLFLAVVVVHDGLTATTHDGVVAAHHVGYSFIRLVILYFVIASGTRVRSV